MQTINLRDVISQKNPELARKLPTFLIKVIGKLVHLEEINRVITVAGPIQGGDFIETAIREMKVAYKAEPDKGLPPVKRPIIIANHPMGGLDAIALMTLVWKDLGNFKILANDFLMAIPNLKDLLIPVNKLGSNRINLKSYESALEGDLPIIQFPAGLCSRRIAGKVQDLPWEKSFLRWSREYARPIIPVYIEGQNSNFFYKLAQMRKKLKIKANLEMFTLPHEMFRQKGRTIGLHIGDPIFPEELIHLPLNEAVQEIRNRLYQLSI